MFADYVVVGAGLTGATIARMLKDAGKDVLVVERRPQIGGNCHDQVHRPSGIPYHTYGPHTFRTNSKKIWDFVNDFDDFYKYELIVKTLVDGEYENWPVSGTYMRKHAASWKIENIGEPRNFRAACLNMMPQTVYEKFVRGYTEKQWNTPAIKLSHELAGRFEVREDDDPRLKKERYQGMPSHGYTHMITNMLEGIPILLNHDYLHGSVRHRKKLFYTGSIDEFYSYKLGRLRYRGQSRRQQFITTTRTIQPAAVVNYPSKKVPYIRSVEWKRFLPNPEDYTSTLVTFETPRDAPTPDECEYPFPDERNRLLLQKYWHTAALEKNILFCGRLGRYEYLDMDAAIGEAWTILDIASI